MSTSPQRPSPAANQPTPQRFFSLMNAHQQTEALKAAIEIELFTAIAEGNTEPAAIARRCHASERGVRILSDFLTIHGLLEKREGKYSLTPDAAAFLDKHSPAYIGGTMAFLLNPRLQEGHARLTEAVRSGASALGEAALQPDSAMWVTFAEAMQPLMAMTAEMMAAELKKGGEAGKVLDIASGHGMFGIAVARHNPKAQVYAVDWQSVLAVGARNAQAAGVGDRFHLLPGSAFEVDLGAGYDLALITNFIHHFDFETSVAFLKRVHAALKPGGRAAILEFIPNPDRVSPPIGAAFSLMMLASTPSGDAYTFAELEAMAKKAGFARAELSPAEIAINRLAVAYK